MRSIARLLIENRMIGLLVLTVVVSSDQVHEPWHGLANLAVAIALVGYAIRLALSQHRQQEELRVRQRAETNLLKAKDQLDRSFQDAKHRTVELNQLTELGQLLQSCLTEPEAYLLVGTALNKFLPECSGALYSMLPVGERVELISQWGTNPPLEKVFDPAECWGPAAVALIAATAAQRQSIVRISHWRKKKHLFAHRSLPRERFPAYWCSRVTRARPRPAATGRAARLRESGAWEQQWRSRCRLRWQISACAPPCASKPFAIR